MTPTTEDLVKWLRDEAATRMVNTFSTLDQQEAESLNDAAKFAAAADLITAQAEQLRQMREDAERYQWLRTAAMIEGTPRSRNGYRISWPTISADPPKDGGNYRDRFDAAIDAARQKEETK